MEGVRMDVSRQLRDALADRYRIDHEIGAGGMATVYLAEDLKHRRRVALKVLRALHRAPDRERADGSTPRRAALTGSIT
jgi:serine/threonine protein kinase